MVVRFDLGDIDNPYLTHKYEISPSVFDIPEDLAINSWIDVWTTQESYLFDPEIQNGLTITGNFMNETWEHAGSFLLKYLPENEDLDIKYFWTYNDNSNLYTLINSSMDGSILENWSAEEHFSNNPKSLKPNYLYHRWGGQTDTLNLVLGSGHFLSISYSEEEGVDTLVSYYFDENPGNTTNMQFKRLRLDAYSGHDEQNLRWIAYGQHGQDYGYYIKRLEFDSHIYTSDKLEYSPFDWNLKKIKTHYDFLLLGFTPYK